MAKVVLKKLPDGRFGDASWSYRDWVIERREWVMGSVGHKYSYDVMLADKLIERFDTLSEVREFLADENDFGEESA